MNKLEFIVHPHKIKMNFIEYSRLGIVYFPVKANSNYSVLNEIKKIFTKNNKYLISTLDHYKKLKELKIDNAQIMTMNVLFSNDNYKFFYMNNIRSFTLGDINQVIYFCRNFDIVNCQFLLRINLSEFDDTFISNMGESLDNIKKSLELLKKSKNTGVSFYISSEFKRESKIGIIEIIKEIQQQIPSICIISIGGVSCLTEKERAFIKQLKIQIILEPGYGMLKDAIDVIIPIIKSNCINDKYTFTLLNGIFSGFLDMVLYKKKFPMYYQYNNKIYDMRDKHNDSKCVTIFGGSGDSSDILGRYYIKENVFYNLKNILVKDVGAYFESFIMNYGNNVKIKYKEM